MELKWNISSSNLSSLSASSDVMDPKRRATPSEDSPIAQIYNFMWVSISHKVVEEAKIYQYLIDNGKKFLNSLQGIGNDSPKESADDIYNRARQIWEFERSLVSSCNYGMKKTVLWPTNLYLTRLEGEFLDRFSDIVLGSCGHRMWIDGSCLCRLNRVGFGRDRWCGDGCVQGLVDGRGSGFRDCREHLGRTDRDCEMRGAPGINNFVGWGFGCVKGFVWKYIFQKLDMARDI
ncbi:hypothetical protein CASFOL_011265 [Castilleja foliolosa]|uniref:Uncharacterized protein n=1 Tax=Castilleja foliolosa TaxID=1961234 RepID=A0ABD3DV12_9LAMI